MNEGIPNRERALVTKEKVVESLSVNPKDVSVLQEYVDLRQESVRTSMDTLHLNVEVAEIYRDAGLIEAALAAFEDAAEQAWQEHQDELYEELISEVKKLSTT